MNELKTTPVGRCIIFKGVKIRPVQSSKGCKGCVFETEAGARSCKQSLSCFAHMRPDHQSVIFTHKEAY